MAQKQDNKRRNFIRLMLVGGASLYFPSCLSESDKSTPIGKQSAPPNIDTAIKEVEVVITEQDVVFLKQADVDYAQRAIRFNLRVQPQPKIIALCKNEKGIQEAIRVARNENLAVSIKSGGHSFEGFSSNDGGLCIDLSLMNSLKLEQDNSLRIGPGAKLGEINNYLLPKNRILPAGSCSGVGIGGLALGGGYGFLARKYGLTCDSLMEVKMVDGQGNIITSNNHKELLWACRGGGNGNFGVIYEMKFNTQAKPGQFTSYRFKAYKLDKERARKLMQAWFENAPNIPNACFSAFVLNGKTLTLLLTDFENNKTALQAFIKLFKSLTDKYSENTKTDIAKALKTYYGRQEPLYFKNASAGLYKSWADVDMLIDGVIEKTLNARGIIFQLNTLGGNINNPQFEEQSAYPHRAYPIFSELQAYYDKPSQEAEKLKVFAEIQNLFHAQGTFPQYRNYPDIDFPHWETAYYGDNYSRLQKIKNEFDPENLIRHPQSLRLDVS